MLYIIFGLFSIIGYALYKQRIKIDVPSFVDSTLPLKRGVFGVYCFTGKQGSGKTYGLNKFIRKHAKGKKIFSNVTLEGIEYTHLTSQKQLLDLRDEKNCYIIYDEIFTMMTKSTKFDKIMMEFLSQQRKQENIFITTAQEWLELPMTYRRFVRIQIECSTRPLGRLGGIFTEAYFDTTQIKWDNLENEYISPIITKKISKYQKRYMETYDTFERIRGLE